MTSYYETLGVDRSATWEQIRAAHRRKAKVSHPDHGGTVGEFLAVQLAYEVLRDGVRRAHYDETGADAGNAGTLRGKAEAKLVALALERIDGESKPPTWGRSELRYRPFEYIKTNATTRAQNLRDEVEQVRAKAGAVEAEADKVTRKAGGVNLVSTALRNNADALRKAAALMVGDAELWDEVAKVAGEYEYKETEQQEQRKETRTLCSTQYKSWVG